MDSGDHEQQAVGIGVETERHRLGELEAVVASDRANNSTGLGSSLNLTQFRRPNSTKTRNYSAREVEAM
jgi:hypothetical protein